MSARLTAFNRLSVLARVAAITALLALLGIGLESVAGVPFVRALSFALRFAAAAGLLLIWALANLPPRRVATGRVVVGVAPFIERRDRQDRPPERSLVQRLRPQPRWEPVVDEEGATQLALPEGGHELAHFLTYRLQRATVDMPEVTLVGLPYVADEQAALAAGRQAGAHLVVWGRTRRGPAGEAEVRFVPRLTVTRSVDPPILASDLRLCGIETLELPVQRLRGWRSRYIGFQHLQSLILGLTLYAYGADDEALNELAAVQIATAGNGRPDASIAAAALLAGNLLVMREDWQAAEKAFMRAAEAETMCPASMVNRGVLYALQGDTVRALDQLNVAVQQAPALALGHHNLAVLQQRVDRLGDAEQHFRMAMDLDPELSPSYRGFAMIARSRGQMAPALHALRQALAAQPDDASARRDLSALLIEGDRLPEAQAQLEQALKLDPDHAATYYLLGLLKQRSGDTPAAIESFEQAIRLQPAFAEAHAALTLLYKQRGDVMPGPAPVSTLSAPVSADARAHLDLGQSYLDQARLPEAEHEFRAAIEKAPDSALAHLRLAQILRRTGAAVAALTELKTALEADTQLLEGYRELAELRREGGDLERAAEALEYAVRIAPADGKTAYVLGNVRAAQARAGGSRVYLEGAIAAYRRAVTLQPDLPGAHYNLALVLWSDGDAVGAIDTLRAGTTLHPQDGEAYRLLGSIYSDLQRMPEALSALERAAERQPEHVPTLLQLAQVQRTLGRPADAIATLQQARRVDGQHVRVLKELGRLYLSEKQFDRAIAAFTRAKELVPERADGYLELGLAYQSAQRVPQALDYFEQAAQRGVDEPELLVAVAGALTACGEGVRAISLLHQAIVRMPNDAQLYYALGQAYTARGAQSEANEAYRLYAGAREMTAAALKG